jgi:membrane protein DedA with SNARE-associated domain
VEHGIIIAYLEQFVRDYGVLAVIIILGLESLGLPLPGESLLIFASFAASRGDISLGLLLISAWAAAVIGDNIGYLIGRTLGHKALVRYGGRIGLTPERIAQVEAVFNRYGPAAVAFARFVNVLRQLNGVVAGMLEMDWRKFLLFNALGGAVWVCTWVLGVYYFSGYAMEIARYAQQAGYAGLILAVLVVGAGLVYWWRRSRRTSEPQPQPQVRSGPRR